MPFGALTNKVMKLQNRPFYALDTSTFSLAEVGEITGNFEVVHEFEKFGFHLVLVSDDEGTYLIVK